ncbi:hypothetical protein [Methylocystis echinoides]
MAVVSSSLFKPAGLRATVSVGTAALTIFAAFFLGVVARFGFDHALPAF